MNDETPALEPGDVTPTPQPLIPGQEPPLLDPSPQPEKIGRYRIIRILGAGGFGRVYLAHDDGLDRPVAIKVPNPDRISRPKDVEEYLEEARTVAKLDHPHIVPVYDVGSTDDGVCYVVSKFVEGKDLAARLKESPFNHRESAEIVAIVADALHYAHTQHLVHRDVKPANILIDPAGKPILADFGLALRDKDFGKGPGFAGTPAYMSPEQARGEGHRVDGRSDIFSLGVVFYEMLSGRRPFSAPSQLKLLDLIATAEARPPRSIDDRIPRDLEWICLKALAKRLSERYTTAKDMADDLRSSLQNIPSAASPFAAPGVVNPPPGSTQEVTPRPTTAKDTDSDLRPIKIIPKGLRSFDEHDADFFLDLLPGPRNREGLPESLRFWKTRIEIIDSDKAFKVGLIYGPSGCGKSSLMKAGLLPRLAKHALVVYVEATPDDTEARLLKGLRKISPDLSPQSGLVDALMAIRQGRVLRSGQKAVLVIDQFEQWLHSHRSEENTELVAALRHCDGDHLQAIVMVRDDFWMAATRFMRDLEIELLQGRNTSPVDLFDRRHAQKVLTAFGVAYGNLPERASETTQDQQAFLDQAITEIAQDGKIISVRLALFAEMVKGKPWIPSTLREVGGTEGVGVTFLEETFASSQANPKHRLHQKAAQRVLKTLLPETGADIKGQMRSEDELRQASGYADRPRDFAELMSILDGEIRLITPTDPEGADDDQPSAPSAGRFYQLTHDYLVPSLRDWLTRKQRETRKGRAELRLAERSSLWNAKPENRFLPSPQEWATIRWHTAKKDWSEPQRKMIRRAERVHGGRALGIAALLALLTWGGIESYGNLRASSLVESLKTASTADVPKVIEQLPTYRRWANPRLVRLLNESEKTSRTHLHASLALLPVDSNQVEFLFERLLKGTAGEVAIIGNAFKKTPPKALIPDLWSVMVSAKRDDPRLLPAASALALFDPQNRQNWGKPGVEIAAALVKVNPILLGEWTKAMEPVRDNLKQPLASIFRDQQQPEGERSVATTILADYARDDGALLAGLLMDSEPSAFAVIYPKVEAAGSRALDVLQSELEKTSEAKSKQDDVLGKENHPEAKEDLIWPEEDDALFVEDFAWPIEHEPELKEDDKVKLAARQARAAVALVRLGKADAIWPLLAHSPDPCLRSFIVNWLSLLGADPGSVVAGFDGVPSTAKPTLAPGQTFMDAVLFHPETSIRRALIIALGAFEKEKLAAGDRDPLVLKLLDLYRNDPDAGIHGAAEWILREWKEDAKIKLRDGELMKLKDRGDRRWFVDSLGQTFTIINGPVEFLMGSPTGEQVLDPVAEILHKVSIPRRFAIASKEVSREMYRRFVKESSTGKGRDIGSNRYSPYPDGPINGISWYDAAAFCNWLSEQEGLKKDEWCYIPKDQEKYELGMTIPADVLKRKGYRLPTEAEWEYACRSGTRTSCYFGRSHKLLNGYARYQGNSKLHTWPCGTLRPNDLGLFDMLGNVFEWMEDEYQNYEAEPRSDDVVCVSHVQDKPRLLRGGAFDEPPYFVRSAFRGCLTPPFRFDDHVGFRPCRTYP